MHEPKTTAVSGFESTGLHAFDGPQAELRMLAQISVDF